MDNNIEQAFRAGYLDELEKMAGLMDKIKGGIRNFAGDVGRKLRDDPRHEAITKKIKGVDSVARLTGKNLATKALDKGKNIFNKHQSVSRQAANTLGSAVKDTLKSRIDGLGARVGKAYNDRMDKDQAKVNKGIDALRSRYGGPNLP